jgi:HAD superfamily hydrolase (TIGR01509 family)
VTYRAILFDAGNTLVGLDHPRIAARTGSALGIPLTTEGLVQAGARAAVALEGDAGNDQDRALRFLRLLFIEAGVPEGRMGEVQAILGQLHAERHLWSGVDPRTVPALKRLGAAGYRLGVVSNSDGRVAEALEAVGFGGVFEVVVDSKLAGVEKPDPRIFQVALDALKVPAADALYVGDLYEVDVVGARRAGMDVVLLDPAGDHAGRDVPTAPDVAAVAERLLGTGAIR